MCVPGTGSGSWLFGIRRVDRRPCCEVQRAAGAGASESKLSTEQHGPWADRPRPHGRGHVGLSQSVRRLSSRLSFPRSFGFSLRKAISFGLGPRLAAVLRFARCSRAGGAGHSAQERKEVSSLMHDRGPTTTRRRLSRDTSRHTRTHDAVTHASMHASATRHRGASRREEASLRRPRLDYPRGA